MKSRCIPTCVLLLLITGCSPRHNQEKQSSSFIIAPPLVMTVESIDSNNVMHNVNFWSISASQQYSHAETGMWLEKDKRIKIRLKGVVVVSISKEPLGYKKPTGPEKLMTIGDLEVSLDSSPIVMSRTTIEGRCFLSGTPTGVHGSALFLRDARVTVYDEKWEPKRSVGRNLIELSELIRMAESIEE